jgi:glycosyltransferase involved in cell wall biosynthesis
MGAQKALYHRPIVPSPAGRQPRIAIVHDRLNVRGGGEMFLEELCRLYPDAPVYTLIYDPAVFSGSPIAAHQIRTSFLDKLPFAAGNHRIYIPLMPWAVESLDLSNYDLIISSSAAFAHGIRTHDKQLHISYIHSPMRYAWHQNTLHTQQLGFGAWPIRTLLAALRGWDRRAAQRPQYLLANSNWTATCVQAAFGRGSTVIYPPVQVQNFRPAPQRGDYYLTVSRLVPYKRVDVIVRAFSQLGLPLVVAGDGPQAARLLTQAANNITFRSGQTDAQIAELMGAAKAFVYAAEEDFGIAPVEAQAAGCPVIAYGHGGLIETVVEGQTGLFFNEQTEEALIEAVRRFENGEWRFKIGDLQSQAENFNVLHFRDSFTNFINSAWQEFTNQ